MLKELLFGALTLAGGTFAAADCGACDAIYQVCIETCLTEPPSTPGKWSVCHTWCFCKTANYEDCGTTCGFDLEPCKIANEGDKIRAIDDALIKIKHDRHVAENEDSTHATTTCSTTSSKIDRTRSHGSKPTTFIISSIATVSTTQTGHTRPDDTLTDQIAPVVTPEPDSKFSEDVSARFNDIEARQDRVTSCAECDNVYKYCENICLKDNDQKYCDTRCKCEAVKWKDCFMKFCSSWILPFDVCDPPGAAEKVEPTPTVDVERRQIINMPTTTCEECDNVFYLCADTCLRTYGDEKYCFRRCGCDARAWKDCNKKICATWISPYDCTAVPATPTPIATSIDNAVDALQAPPKGFAARDGSTTPPNPIATAITNAAGGLQALANEIAPPKALTARDDPSAPPFSGYELCDAWYRICQEGCIERSPPDDKNKVHRCNTSCMCRTMNYHNCGSLCGFDEGCDVTAVGDDIERCHECDHYAGLCFDLCLEVYPATADWDNKDYCKASCLCATNGHGDCATKKCSYGLADWCSKNERNAVPEKLKLALDAAIERCQDTSDSGSHEHEPTKVLAARQTTTTSPRPIGCLECDWYYNDCLLPCQVNNAGGELGCEHHCNRFTAPYKWCATHTACGYKDDCPEIAAFAKKLGIEAPSEPSKIIAAREPEETRPIGCIVCDQYNSECRMNCPSGGTTVDCEHYCNCATANHLHCGIHTACGFRDDCPASVMKAGIDVAPVASPVLALRAPQNTVRPIRCMVCDQYNTQCLRDCPTGGVNPIDCNHYCNCKTAGYLHCGTHTACGFKNDCPASVLQLGSAMEPKSAKISRDVAASNSAINCGVCDKFKMDCMPRCIATTLQGTDDDMCNHICNCLTGLYQTCMKDCGYIYDSNCPKAPGTFAKLLGIDASNELVGIDSAVGSLAAREAAPVPQTDIALEQDCLALMWDCSKKNPEYAPQINFPPPMIPFCKCLVYQHNADCEKLGYIVPDTSICLPMPFGLVRPGQPTKRQVIADVTTTSCETESMPTTVGDPPLEIETTARAALQKRQTHGHDHDHGGNSTTTSTSRSIRLPGFILPPPTPIARHLPRPDRLTSRIHTHTHDHGHGHGYGNHTRPHFTGHPTPPAKRQESEECAGCPPLIAECVEKFCPTKNVAEGTSCVCGRLSEESNCPDRCFSNDCAAQFPSDFDMWCKLVGAAPPA